MSLLELVQIVCLIALACYLALRTKPETQNTVGLVAGAFAGVWAIILIVT